MAGISGRAEGTGSSGERPRNRGIRSGATVTGNLISRLERTSRAFNLFSCEAVVAEDQGIFRVIYVGPQHQVAEEKTPPMTQVLSEPAQSRGRFRRIDAILIQSQASEWRKV